MKSILQIIDDIDIAISKIDHTLCIDGHIYCLLGYIYNTPLLIALGALHILMSSDAGDWFVNIIANYIYNRTFKG